MGNVNQKSEHEHDDQDSSSLSTFTCEICIEPITLRDTKFKYSNRCVHPLCTDCVIKYIQFKLHDNVSDIKCPSLHCRHSLDPFLCRPKLTRQLFDKWCDALFDSAVLGFDRVYCPNRECSVLIVNECGGGSKLKRCVCFNCKKPFCFKCKVPWHAGSRCNEIGEIRDENDVAFGVMSETNMWKRCPMCRHCIERDQGCRFVQCRCGVKFCYRCGKKLCMCKASKLSLVAFFCLLNIFISILVLIIKVVIKHV